jgi:hypothetical protein
MEGRLFMARELLYLFQYPIGHLCQNDWRKRFLNGFKKKREVGSIDQVEPLCFVFRKYTNIHLLDNRDLNAPTLACPYRSDGSARIRSGGRRNQT